MYYENCIWYVDMGEHNKPLCERKSLRPAKCSECPVYIRNIETENAKLRELVRAFDWCTENFDTPNKCDGCPLPQSDALNPECELIMRELGIREEQ